MSETNENAPDFLGNQPRRGNGVRRLNRVPLMIAGFMLFLILGAVTYTYQMRLAEIRQREALNRTRPEPANFGKLFEDAPDSGFIPANQPPPLNLNALQEAPQEQPVQGQPTQPAESADPYAEEWERYLRERERLNALRKQRLRQAFSAPTKIKSTAPRPSAPQDTEPSGQAQPASLAGQLAALYEADYQRQRRLAGVDDEEKDINRAEQKRAFLSDRKPQGRGENYLPGGREAPLSPYEVKAGTVIPAIMVGGINSDLPGQIIGQVTENVYDTATGRHILIPQGAKLVGTYDNAVTSGQERVLAAWTRIIYPDASSIDLGKMPGTDQSGFAGFQDEVNNHFWKTFGNALLLSVLSAGVQISQGGETPGDNGLNAQQIIAAGLGQQFGQLGQEFARRNSQIQPTLEIRPGYRFTVMVTKDIVIRPYRPAALR